jgi:hypothetical protein
VSPVIFRVNFFLFVTSTVLVIIPSGYQTYRYLSVTELSRCMLKSGNFCFLLWSARVITRRLPVAAGPCRLPASPGILGLGISFHFPRRLVLLLSGYQWYGYLSVTYFSGYNHVSLCFPFSFLFWGGEFFFLGGAKSR